MGFQTDLTGQRFGRLTVLGYAGKNNQNRAMWNCRCECGNEVIARTDNLKSGDKKSCGCLNNERRSQWCIARNTTHGKAHTRLYRVWCAMRQRCKDKKLPEYKNYGGRGVRVCTEWENDFQAFYDWAMANGYDKTAPHGKCTIDRIDVNGDYSPENCRFADTYQQARNKRNNRYITHNGITMLQTDWARHYGKNRAFFSGDPEIVERRMNGCDEYIRIYGKVPPFAHCVKLIAEYARRKF